MTIGKINKYLCLLIIPFCLSGCKVDTRFKVFGDNTLLKKMTINIESFSDGGANIETLLYNGEIFKVSGEEIDCYNIYVSCSDSLIGMLHVDNIDQWADDCINHLYINQKDNAILFQYIGRECEVEQRGEYEFSRLLTIEEYMEAKNITLDENQQHKLNLFFRKY